MEIRQDIPVKYETCYGSLKPGDTFMLEGRGDDLFLKMRSPEFSYVKLSDGDYNKVSAGEYNKVKWNNAPVHRVGAHIVVTSL